MKRIDFENHFYVPEFIQVLKNRKKCPYYDEGTELIHWNEHINQPQGPLLEQLMKVGAQRVKMLDEIGVSTAVMSTAPGIEILDKDEAISLSRLSNEAMYRMSQEFPGRFLGLAALPVSDAHASCRELERCIKELGFVGWLTHSNYVSNGIDDLQYRPILEKTAELGAFMYLHPFVSPSFRQLDYGFALAGSGLGFTVDCMTAAMRLILSGVFDEIPELTVMIGHFGEALPFLLDRIDNRIENQRNPFIKCKHEPSYYFKHNILVASSGNTSKAAFECTKAVLGVDRILIGTDMPFDDSAEMIRFIDSLELSVEDREKICYKNAEKLFSKIKK